MIRLAKLMICSAIQEVLQGLMINCRFRIELMIWRAEELFLILVDEQVPV